LRSAQHHIDIKRAGMQQQRALAILSAALTAAKAMAMG
jgi:hypothetical protein